MHLPLLPLALILLSATTTLATTSSHKIAGIPASAHRVFFRADPTNPALTWHVSDFDIGCSPGGCIYNFNILGIASENTPGFNTTCHGTTMDEDYVECKDKEVLSQVAPQGYTNYTVDVQHRWRKGQFAAFYAVGGVNVTSEQRNFKIPVEEASILRQIVAGPRLAHAETGLDLCYVTDNIIATSGPSTNYPKLAYRTPLKQLVSFLDDKHGTNWCIWEFRAEGTGYPDSEVYGRIHHFPFPDHHPPPFALIPKVVASMRNWLQRLDGPLPVNSKDKEGEVERRHDQGQRVAVVHCKAGKGRSGTIACSYLISQEGWKMEDVLERFTERRMRVGFGSGVSIPSQLRWVRYVDRWTNEMGKTYVERPIEILEIHVWGLRDGVKVAVEGFVDDGQKLKTFHHFHRDERIVLPGDTSTSQSNSTQPSDDGGNSSSNDTDGKTKTENIKKKKKTIKSETTSPTSTTSFTPNDRSPLSAESSSSSLPIPGSSPPTSTNCSTPLSQTNSRTDGPTITPPKSTPSNPQPPPTTSAVLLRPSKPLILPTPDINIDFERRSKAASYTGLAMVTSVAHVWFNPYFEGGDKHPSGVFEIDWDAMDGIKGTTRKGIKMLDHVKVLWRYAGPDPEAEDSAQATMEMRPGMETRPGLQAQEAGKEHRRLSSIITEPRPGEPISETRVADWRLRETNDGNGGGDGDESSRSSSSVEEDAEKGQENLPIRQLEEIAGTSSKKSGNEMDKASA
ncbi:hypothetical protein BJX61DRAFT_546562 [Aspergillus egyptiacus]|nr:hypothetical protein BJX61DRAFT_546562 [Aspergillus egyptiacus]